MTSDWTTVLAELWDGEEAEAFLGVLDQYQLCLVEYLATTEELLQQAQQLDASASGVAETVALLRAVAGELGDSSVAVRRLMRSIGNGSADGCASADPAAPAVAGP